MIAAAAAAAARSLCTASSRCVYLSNRLRKFTAGISIICLTLMTGNSGRW